VSSHCLAAFYTWEDAGIQLLHATKRLRLYDGEKSTSKLRNLPVQAK